MAVLVDGKGVNAIRKAAEAATSSASRKDVGRRHAEPEHAPPELARRGVLSA
jgi:hypothetical protein